MDPSHKLSWSEESRQLVDCDKRDPARMKQGDRRSKPDGMEVQATIGNKADAGNHLLDLANTIVRDNTNETLPNSWRRKKKKLNERGEICGISNLKDPFKTPLCTIVIR